MALFAFTSEHSSDYKPGGPLPAGYYRARIMNCYEATTKRGDPMLVAELDVRSLDDKTGIKLYHNMPVTYMLKLEQFATACGFTFGRGQTVSFEPAHMVGKYVIVRTYIEPGQNGGMYAAADTVLIPGGEPHLGPMTEEELFAVGLQSDGQKIPRDRKPAKTQARDGQHAQRTQQPQQRNTYQPPQNGYRNPQSQAAIDEQDDEDIPF